MKKRNFLAVLASCAVMASMFSVTANAANYADENQAAGGNTTFTKYLVLDAEANVPNATFKYTIAAGTAIDGTADNMQVYAGKFAVNGEGEVTAPVVSDVTFTAGNSTTDGADGDGITNDASKKYASIPQQTVQTVTVSQTMQAKNMLLRQSMPILQALSLMNPVFTVIS